MSTASSATARLVVGGLILFNSELHTVDIAIVQIEYLLNSLFLPLKLVQQSLLVPRQSVLVDPVPIDINGGFPLLTAAGLCCFFPPARRPSYWLMIRRRFPSKRNTPAGCY